MSSHQMSGNMYVLHVPTVWDIYETCSIIIMPGMNAAFFMAVLWNSLSMPCQTLKNHLSSGNGIKEEFPVSGYELRVGNAWRFAFNQNCFTESNVSTNCVIGPLKLLLTMGYVPSTYREVIL